MTSNQHIYIASPEEINQDELGDAINTATEKADLGALMALASRLRRHCRRGFICSTGTSWMAARRAAISFS